jgi:hypothetical protein
VVMQAMVLVIYISFMFQSCAKRAAARKANAGQLPSLPDEHLTQETGEERAHSNVPVATVVMPASAPPHASTQSPPAIPSVPSVTSVPSAQDDAQSHNAISDVSENFHAAVHVAVSVSQPPTEAETQNIVTHSMDIGTVVAECPRNQAMHQPDATIHADTNTGALLLAQKLVALCTLLYARRRCLRF